MRPFSVCLILALASHAAAQDPFGDLGDLKIARPEDKVDMPGTSAPRGAIVLFDGKNLDGWVSRNGKDAANWTLLPQGILEVKSPTADIITRQTFDGKFKLHVEFRVGYQPRAVGQRRGNSGVYLQSRYELQILDSYGAVKKQKDDCGALYNIAAPLENVCKAPTVWQSFDVEFTATSCDMGKKIAPALASVFHNGVKIHDNVKITSDNTLRGLGGNPCEPGPILLQENGCPVQFRNIWLLPIKD